MRQKFLFEYNGLRDVVEHVEKAIDKFDEQLEPDKVWIMSNRSLAIYAKGGDGRIYKVIFKEGSDEIKKLYDMVIIAKAGGIVDGKDTSND